MYVGWEAKDKARSEAYPPVTGRMAASLTLTWAEGFTTQLVFSDILSEAGVGVKGGRWK